MRSLLDIIADVRRRWRLKLAVRGAARVAVTAFVLFLVAAYGLEWARFTPASIISARVVMLVVVLAAAWVFLVRPLRRRVTDEQVALYLEEHDPSLQAMVVSAVEASRSASGDHSQALVRRLVEQAIEKCVAADSARRVEQLPLRRWATALATVGVVAVLAVLLGPAFLRNAVSALLLVSRDVEAAAPYRIDVKPGTTTVPKGADESITAKLLGFNSEDASVWTRRSPNEKFEAVPLAKNDGGQYEGILFDVKAPLDYYVEAAGVRSATYTLKVVDLPYVQRMDLEYHFPAYTGLDPQKVEDGGDIAVLRGTEVQVKVIPTMKTTGGRIALNENETIPLALQADGSLTASFKADKDGFYHVELNAPTGEKVTASPKYTIDTLADEAPTVTFHKPGRDTSASPIEEVFVEANADDDYGVKNLELVYSVNGGPEKTVKLFDGARRMPEVTAGHTFYLEEMGVQPGDSVSYYARATDNDLVGGAQQASSDLYFIRIRPFNKNFRQAQSQAGGGGGGGGGGGSQVEALSEQERQIIAATFNIQRDRKKYSSEKLRQNSNVVSLSQARLREQVETLLTRMNSQLVQRDPAFEKVGELLPQAVTSMKEAEGKLSSAAVDASLPPENKALQILQKAEEEYQLQVSVQRQQGGGGGGGGSQMQQDLADIFEQELDKMASRYETASQASQQAQDQQVDQLLEKLKELARRQQAEAERQRRRALEGQLSGGGNSGAQQRALADQVEQEARQLEKLARDEQRPDLAEAARQMQQAADAMRRAAASGGQGAQAQAQAALDKLQQTQRKLQQSLSDRAQRDIEDAKQRADEAARQEQEIADMARQLGTSGAARYQQNQQLSTRKQALEQKLDDLEQQIDRAARDSAKDQKAASKKMTEAGDALRDNQLKDKVRSTQVLVNRGISPQMLSQYEANIQQGLDEVRKKLDDAAAAIGQNGSNAGDRKEQELERAQRLARGLQSLQERTRERAEADSKNAQGQNGQGDRNGQNQRGSQPGQGQQAQNQQGQRGQQGRGQQGQQGQGQGQQGQQGQGGQGQQAQNNQQGGQGGGGGNQFGGPRNGANDGRDFNGRVGDYAGGYYTNGGDYGWGGWWDGRNFRLNPDDVRQLQSEARQWANDARDLRGMLHGNDIDPKQLDEIIRALQQLQDERVYKDPAELLKLQTFASEQLKRIEFNLRRQVDDTSSVALTGSDEVPDQFRSLVEQYYRSLAQAKK